MAIDKVREYFRQFGLEDKILEFDVSSATVDLAAQAVGVEGARICKTLSFKDKDGGCILIQAAGDARIDNRKFKDKFHLKAKMNVKVYTDESLKRFDTVFPACGSSNSAIEFTCDELFRYSNAIEWVDVCKLPEEVNE